MEGWSDEEGFESGDCDDEDECTGMSGLGPPPRRKRLRIFAGRPTHPPFTTLFTGGVNRIVVLALKMNFNCYLGGFK